LAVVDVVGTPGNTASVLVEDQTVERELTINSGGLKSDSLSLGQVRCTFDGERTSGDSLNFSRGEGDWVNFSIDVPRAISRAASEVFTRTTDAVFTATRAVLSTVTSGLTKVRLATVIAANTSACGANATVSWAVVTVLLSELCGKFFTNSISTNTKSTIDCTWNIRGRIGPDQLGTNASTLC